MNTYAVLIGNHKPSDPKDFDKYIAKYGYKTDSDGSLVSKEYDITKAEEEEMKQVEDMSKRNHVKDIVFTAVLVLLELVMIVAMFASLILSYSPKVSEYINDDPVPMAAIDNSVDIKNSKSDIYKIIDPTYGKPETVPIEKLQPYMERVRSYSLYVKAYDPCKFNPFWETSEGTRPVYNRTALSNAHNIGDVIYIPGVGVFTVEGKSPTNYLMLCTTEDIHGSYMTYRITNYVKPEDSIIFNKGDMNYA